ncbi:MAG: ATP-binding protein [Cyanobacteriota bacterium]|nr:ATP-binding protein [Cyanobacteriota bacterium]MDY6359471.1 ATP-binding protein [Cyanobacteriota bacterium]MDY6364653.1 ATP-binding protein [Cyanobacteriota bacterium]MDY6382744.1 ATP-binding protein [Cyanobacteriota bacterium]
MLNFKFHRLKIIEQIAIVFFFAVVIPMSISGFVINNVNQQAVRHQLRESAILVASMVSDEMDYLIQSSEATTLQIADALEYLPTTYQKNKFLKEMEKKYPYCQKLSIVKNQKEMEKLTDSSKIDEQPIISTQLKDGSFLVFLFNSKNIDIRLFKSLEDDNRQIYIMLNNHHLIASHNFTPDVFKETIDMLPSKSELHVNSPILFGDEKNQPIVYLRCKNPKYSIIVRTTESIAKKAIIDNRVKIILSVLITILFTMVLIGFYMFYLYINIRQLFKAIMALSKGNYEHQIRLLKTYFTPYELVFLANEFNKMASEIHKQYNELSKKNKELKELNEFRSNLIDTVSHELRTPLTSIQGYTSRLMRQDIVIDEETKQKSLRIIKEQSERLNRLIEDLLTIPDIEGMRLRTVNTNVSLDKIFTQSELLLRKHEGHRITVNLAQDFPQVIADKGRLEQVIVNLYENAVKYAYPDTDIIVDTEVKGDKAIITVKNQCDKIPKKKLKKLFEKFIRLDDEMTRTTRGSGLGLFIVKGLVEAMNGTISLASTDEYGFIATITLNIAK